MGLHTGEARSAERGYVGIAVHRARRVCEAGDGQMVVSSATHAIVAAEPPQGVRLQDLGEVRLPGFDEPERLYQIVAEGLPETSTDLRPRGRGAKSSGPCSSERPELAALDKAIGETRTARGGLVVIEGPPGIGKTSLLAEGRAAASGFSLLHARGSELESAFSFGVVRQLFEPAISRASSEGEATLFEGAAGHAGRLFRDDLENALANEDVAFSLLHGLYWLTLNLAESQPLVIAIDDLQWADAPSLRWLSYLARRIEGECHLRYSHSAPHRARESRARGAAGRFCNDPSATERAELSGGCRAGSGGAGGRRPTTRSARLVTRRPGGIRCCFASS